MPPAAAGERRLMLLVFRMTAPLLSALLALSLIHLLGAMVPGPNTVVTAQISASRSAREGMMCVAGVVVATLVWVSLTLAGVGMVLQQLGALYTALKWAGAAYLVWIGASMLWRAARQPAQTGPPQAGPAPRRLPASAFRTGLLTNLSNPKSAIFWTSVFVVAVPSQAPAWFYIAVVTLIGVQTALWYGFVALVFASGPARRAYQRLGRLIEGTTGAVMIGFGLKLAADTGAAR